jgi:hypothetical protein
MLEFCVTRQETQQCPMPVADSQFKSASKAKIMDTERLLLPLGARDLHLLVMAVALFWSTAIDGHPPFHVARLPATKVGQ